MGGYAGAGTVGARGGLGPVDEGRGLWRGGVAASQAVEGEARAYEHA